jgi:hypothetical protein
MKALGILGIATGLLGMILTTACGDGHYYAAVAVGPPAPLVETPYGYAPGTGYIWTPGFYDYGGGSWAWHRGEWRRPPHNVDHWVAPRWERRGGGYRQRPGGWQHGNHIHH